MKTFIRYSFRQRVIAYCSMEYANIKATIQKKQFKFLMYYMILKISYFLNFSFFKKDISWNINDIKIVLPASIHAYGVVIEVFFLELYKKISGYKTVLDLGGFIGESALYFAQHNHKIIVVESDPLHYKFLEENCKNNKNIISILGAVGIEESHVHIERREIIDSCNQTSINSNHDLIQVSTIPIQSLLLDYKPDIIKMDIEGGEYDIIDLFIKYPDLFNFLGGIIEFHFFEETKRENVSQFISFLEFLEKLGYKYDLFDNTNRKIYINIIKEYKLIACNIYFSKE